MDYLKEIISIVDKNKTKNIEIIGSEKSKERKLYKLYDGISSGKITSDTKACQVLYNNENPSKGYRNLKSRLEKRVLNTLFFIDINSSSFSDFQKAYYNCYKNLAAIKFLAGKGGRKASIKLTEKTLKQALKFGLNDVAIPLLKDLRFFHGTILGNQKSFQKYNSILKQILKDNYYEEQAREMYDTLASHFVHSKTIKSFHIKMAVDYAKKLEGYMEKTNYRGFHIYAHQLLVLRYQIENNHAETIKACNRALLYFEKDKYLTNNQILVFVFKRLSSYIQLKEYEKADIDAKKCLELVPEGGLNWFITSQFNLVLLFHSQRFEEAFTFYRHVRAIQKKKKSRSEVGGEFWNIIEAYIDYFIRVGKIKLEEGKRRPRFDAQTFLRSVPGFAKDKRGMNILILVLQVLYFLNDGDYDEMIDRTERLKTYTSRYLRNDENLRSNCFIRMLAKVSESNFNRIALERNTKDLLKKLKSKPIEVSNQPIEMEIFPLEILWDLVLDSLETAPTKKRRSNR